MNTCVPNIKINESCNRYECSTYFNIQKIFYRPIFDAIISDEIRLVLSNEILSEYTEKLEEKTSSIVAINISDFLSKSDHVDKVEVYYKWNLITQDKDDNKFVNCAIAGNAQLLVSNDKHFNALKDIKFPKVQIITSKDFLETIRNIDSK